MKTVLAPVAEVDVTSGVDENSLPFSPVGSSLSNVKPSVGVLHLEMILQTSDVSDKFLFLGFVVLTDLLSLPNLRRH